MSSLSRAQKALKDAKERRSTAARRLANTAGKSNHEITVLQTEFKAAEIAVARTERELALTERTARIGFAATSHGRTLARGLYALR